jgi:hypothetical protein
MIMAPQNINSEPKRNMFESAIDPVYLTVVLIGVE